MADGLGVIFLQIVQAGSQRHDLAVLDRSGEALGKGRRDQGARITDEQQFGIIRGGQRGMRRFKGGVDVGRLAVSLGGGGHRLAAGFTGYGTLDDVVESVRAAL